jgi:hypothetical protein
MLALYTIKCPSIYKKEKDKKGKKKTTSRKSIYRKDDHNAL